MGDYKGNGGLTREQFLYHETKTVARLMTDEKLFQKKYDEYKERIINKKQLAESLEISRTTLDKILKEKELI